MNAPALQAYLHTHIPISAALGVEVMAASAAEVRVSARLEPNLNHRATAFGGSVAAVAILAGWGLLRVRLDYLEPMPHLVIQRSTVDYLLPIEADFQAVCLAPADERWERFGQALGRRGRGRLDLNVDVNVGDARAARFHGVFAALDPGRNS